MEVYKKVEDEAPEIVASIRNHLNKEIVGKSLTESSIVFDKVDYQAKGNQK